MSRVGKQPIPIPSGVTVNLGEGQVQVKGPKGELTGPIPAGITPASRPRSRTTRSSSSGRTTPSPRVPITASPARSPTT